MAPERVAREYIVAIGLTLPPESPGTKTYTESETESLLDGFEAVTLQVFSPGDLLLNQPSPRYRAPDHRLGLEASSARIGRKVWP